MDEPLTVLPIGVGIDVITFPVRILPAGFEERRIVVVAVKRLLKRKEEQYE
jgi:hypothetical protein